MQESQSQFNEDTPYDIILENLRGHMRDYEKYLADHGSSLKTAIQYAGLLRSMMRKFDVRDPILFEASMREYSPNSLSQRRTTRNKYLAFIGMDVIDIREQRQLVKENPKEVWAQRRKLTDRVVKNLERAIHAYLDHYERKLIPADRALTSVVAAHITKWEEIQSKLKEQRLRVATDTLTRKESKLRRTPNEELTGQDVGEKDVKFLLAQLQQQLTASDADDTEVE